MKKIYFLFLFAIISVQCIAQNVVINKVFNSGTAAGTGDAIELIVVGAHPLTTVDLRGMMIKDYTNNGNDDTGGCYTFTTNTLWSNVKSGTIIVLRRNAGSSADVSITAVTDFNLDINLDDATYFTAGTGIVDVASGDMIIIKSAGSAAAGEVGAIHTVAFGTTNPTTRYAAITTTKMRGTTGIGTGEFGIAQNFNGTLIDYNNQTAFIRLAANSNPGVVLGSPSVLVSGNSRNTRFVNILRPTVAIESVYNSGLANGIGDIIKLKVLSASSLDMRGMFIKDFKTNGTESNIYYKFSDATGSIFESVPSGTVITLTRAASGTSADVNSADLTLDLILLNTAPAANTEFNSSNTDATNFLDIDENDMLVLQPVRSGTDYDLATEPNVTHAMAFGTGFSAGGSRYATIGFGPKVGINDALVADARIAVQNTSISVNYYNSNLARTLNTLPVELISFTAKKQLNSVSLKWSTLTESNNARYDVYRASNSTDFVKIVSVNGAGTSSKTLNYNYIDNNPLSGDNYYKLVQIDNDGKEKALKVVVININSDSQFINVFKNSNNNLSVNTFSSDTQKGEIMLLDISGRILYKQSVLLQKGNNLSELNINPQSGLYILKVKLENDILVKKILN